MCSKFWINYFHLSGWTCLIPSFLNLPPFSSFSCHHFTYVQKHIIQVFVSLIFLHFSCTLFDSALSGHHIECGREFVQQFRPFLAGFQSIHGN